MRPVDIKKKARAILGVSDDADRNMIRRAYRKLAKKYHPDFNPDDKNKSLEEKFKLITEAYEVLCSGEKNAGRYAISKANVDVKESFLNGKSYQEWWMEQFKDLRGLKLRNTKQFSRKYIKNKKRLDSNS